MPERDPDTIATLAATKAILERVELEMTRLRGLEGHVGQLTIYADELRQSVDGLKRTLHIGNGQEPLVQRVFVLEKAHASMAQSFDKAVGKLEKATQTAQERTNKEKGAILVAIIATLGSIATAWMSARGA